MARDPSRAAENFYGEETCGELEEDGGKNLIIFLDEKLTEKL